MCVCEWGGGGGGEGWRGGGELIQSICFCLPSAKVFPTITTIASHGSKVFLL